MKVAVLIGTALLAGVAQSAPVVLSSDDIADSYESAPEVIRATKSWFGLFIAEPRAGEDVGALRVAAATVRFVDTEGNRGGRIETRPPNAVLLVSDVPNITPGPARTSANPTDLSLEEPEAHITLGERQYIVRLNSQDPGYCDTVITLSADAVTQRVFDIGGPSARFSCDEPHFRIHWAGDLDRDGRLDMLVTFSEKYSYHPRQLLLSSAARSPNLVGEVARYERFSQ